MKDFKTTINYLSFLVSFASTYQFMVKGLYQPLLDSDIVCGDDGLSDIMDSFPLFGPTMYKRALKGLKGNGDTLYKKLYQGENYISLRLEEMVQNFGLFLKSQKEVFEIASANKKDLPLFIGTANKGAAELLEKRLKE